MKHCLEKHVDFTFPKNKRGDILLESALILEINIDCQ